MTRQCQPFLVRNVYRFIGKTRTLDSHPSRLRRKLDPDDDPYSRPNQGSSDGEGKSSYPAYIPYPP